MRCFTDAYEAQAATMFYPRRPGFDDYAALLAKKEAALAGYIAWVALQNPRHVALGPQPWGRSNCGRSSASGSTVCPLQSGAVSFGR